MIHIRKSSSSDAPALTEIWRASVLATHDFLSRDDFLEIEKLVAEQYLPNVEVWLVEDAGKPVGFMGMSDHHIDSLFIAPDQRGKGIGKLMIAHAKAVGNPLTVDVNEQNLQGVGFTGIWDLSKPGVPKQTIRDALIRFCTCSWRTVIDVLPGVYRFR